MAEKVQPTINIVEQNDKENVSKPHHIWRPGYRQRLPVVGIAAIAGAIACTVIIIIVMVTSNNVRSNTWPSAFSPNVVIGGFNTLGNILLGTAMAEGVAIAWWRRAMAGATLGELQAAWEYSIGTSAAFLLRFELSSIALAALGMKITIADSVLLQLATQTYVGPDVPKNVTLMGVASKEFPTTGYVVSNGTASAQPQCDCYMIGDTFTPLVNSWGTSNGFFAGYEQLFYGCTGVCYSYVQGMGFEISCSEKQESLAIAEAALQAYSTYNGDASHASEWSNISIFNSQFTTAYLSDAANYTAINLDLQYFQSANPYGAGSETGCQGKNTQISCQLRPALLEYPVKITNYTTAHVINGVNLASYNKDNTGSTKPYSFQNKQAADVRVLSYLYPLESKEVGSATSVGGIANALSTYFTSTAQISYNGNNSWSLRQTGTLSGREMYGPPNMGTCDCSFRDSSLDELVSAVNQLTFLTSIGLINQSSYANTSMWPAASTLASVTNIDNTTLFASWEPLPASTQIADVVYYQTNYLYLSLGSATFLICLLCIIPSYWAYGQLGRRVTLAPIEVAHAFGAPILSHTEEGHELSGFDVDQVIGKLGSRRVQYGAVDVEHVAAASPVASPTLEPNGSSQEFVLRRTSTMLRMEAPGRVRPLSTAM